MQVFSWRQRRKARLVLSQCRRQQAGGPARAQLRRYSSTNSQHRRGRCRRGTGHSRAPRRR
eukprot:8211875-Lingulodinium_polyedra.AAC.1